MAEKHLARSHPSEYNKHGNLLIINALVARKASNVPRPCLHNHVLHVKLADFFLILDALEKRELHGKHKSVHEHDTARTHSKVLFKEISI